MKDLYQWEKKYLLQFIVFYFFFLFLIDCAKLHSNQVFPGCFNKIEGIYTVIIH
jgi:hypothetical protein